MRAAIAEQKAAKTQEETATLNVQSALLKADNLRLEQQMAWRRITSDQANSLVSVLKPYPGQQVKTLSVMGDAEGLQYRRDLIVILKKAGWAEDGSQSIFTSTPMGLQVVINPADGRPNGSNGGIVLEPALVLASALFNLKMIPSLALGNDPEVPQGTIVLLVGVKPPIDTP